MIRVLHFARCINRYDFIDNVLQYVDPKRFAVGVAIGSESSDIEVPVFPDGTACWIVPWRLRRDIVAPARRLARILRDWKADVLHTHHFDEALIGWLATRFHRRTKLVVGRHYSTEIVDTMTGWKRLALLMAERVVNRAASRIIVPSSLIKEMLTRHHPVCSSKVDHVPYGFVAAKYAAHGPTTRAETRRQLGMEGRFVIGSFGRLNDVKGQRYLVEAMTRLRYQVPEASLLLVGDGPDRANLERMIKGRGLDGVVRLLGWRRDAMAIMAAVDAVVQPTLTEAFSQVMVEALWMARPLVMTDVSGARDVIRNGKNGLIVPPFDAAALADAIGRLAADSEFRESMAAAGNEYVKSNLNIETVIPGYERSYMKAMGIGEG